MVATQPYSLMVGKHVAAKDLRELIELLKKDAQKFNGGQGSGTGYFMLALLNKRSYLRNLVRDVNEALGL